MNEKDSYHSKVLTSNFAKFSFPFVSLATTRIILIPVCVVKGKRWYKNDRFQSFKRFEFSLKLSLF